MPRQKITTRLLATLKPGDIVRDSDPVGFFAEAGATGISFKVRVDFREGERTAGKSRERTNLKRTLGKYPEVSIEAARNAAKRLLLDAKAGIDPRPKKREPAVTWTVEHAFREYVRNAAKRPGSESTQTDMIDRMKRYLDDWRELPLRDLTREMCETRQLQIAADIKARAKSPRITGARAANTMVRYLSAVWNYAAHYTPLPPVNPCRKIVLIGEVREHHEIPPAELGAWWTAVGALRSPLRRSMHRLGLLSGLRPGNLMAIECAWVRLAEKRIDFPARVMKGRKPFTLPLSAAMVSEVQSALAAGDLLARGSAWLFPSFAPDGTVIATAAVREKAAALQGRTGHALRHTYKTCARLARLPESQIALLMAHRLGGVLDTYGSLEEQFDRLLADQETVSAYILNRVTPTPAPDDQR